MTPQAFIFIGRSGCGKGTQIKLLMEVLKKKDPSCGILYIYSGQKFRDFIKGSSITQRKSKVIYDAGGLQPEFLSIHMWTESLVEMYKGGEHVIFDGTPRKFHEAGALHSIFDFYGFVKPWVVNIEISAEEAMKRLLSRHRFDDNEEEVRKRLDWYETDVVPTVDYYRNNPEYNFIEIDGERTVETIHEDLVKRLGLK